PIADSPVYPASCRDDPPLVIYALQEATPVADMEMPSHTPSSAVGEDAARYSRHVCAVPVVAVSISTCISADMGGSPACTDSLLIPTGRATVPSDSHEPLPLHVAPEKEDAPTTSPGVRKSSKVTSPGYHGKVEPAGPIERLPSLPLPSTSLDSSSLVAFSTPSDSSAVTSSTCSRVAKSPPTTSVARSIASTASVAAVVATAA